jgi:hypothetical protein
MKEEHIEDDGSLGKINYKSNTSPNYDSLDKWFSRNKCKLNNKDLNLIRDWVRAEIHNKEDSDRLFNKISSIFGVTSER